MANNCKPCSDNVFKKLSSNPDLSALLGESKVIEVVGDGEFIFVDKVETDDDKTFTVRYEPYIALSINSFSDNLGLQVKGAEITSFTLSWTYNKAIQTQSLNQGLTAPSVVSGQTSYSLAVSGQSVTTDTTYTLTADDDTGDANAAKTANNSILFGNFVYYGSVTLGNNFNNYDPSASDIKALSNNKLVRNKSGVGNISPSNQGTGNYEIFAAPTSFNINNFQFSINNGPGGFAEVKTLNITNSEGFTEEYTVFRSASDNTGTVDNSGRIITYTVI